MSNLRPPRSSSGLSRYRCTTHSVDLPARESRWRRISERLRGTSERAAGGRGVRARLRDRHERQARRDALVQQENLSPFATARGLDDPHRTTSGRHVSCVRGPQRAAVLVVLPRATQRERLRDNYVDVDAGAFAVRPDRMYHVSLSRRDTPRTRTHVSTRHMTSRRMCGRQAQSDGRARTFHVSCLNDW